MSTCLVLLAHGSPDYRWRAPFERLAAALRAELGVERVRLAYLESASPTLLDAAAAARRAGCQRLRILPLFMAGGGHVDRDLPARADEVRRLHPDLAVEVLPAAGEHPRVAAALREVAAEALQ